MFPWVVLGLLAAGLLALLVQAARRHLGREAVRAVRREFEEHMASADWNGVAHEHEFVDGSPADTIHQAERAADLVVMGTHGLTGLSAALIGSVTYSVLKHATRPVLVVREPQRRFSHG